METYKKIAIVGNGRLDNTRFHKEVLSYVDFIICTDGGANSLDKMKIIPDVVAGDMDSIKPSLLNKLIRNTKTRVIIDDDQDLTDMEIGIEIAHEYKPNEIIILGAIGSRMDHTIANMYSLLKIKNNTKATIVDPHNEIVLVDKKITIHGIKGETTSVLPLTKVHGLTYTGLKWNVKNLAPKFGWFGICNQLTGSSATINLKKGKILVMKTRD